MLKTIASIVFFWCTICSFSQDWKVTYTDAVACASEEHKPIVLVFSGSDWCAPCIKLDKLIWQSKVFKAYAADHYVLYKADFPRKKANRQAENLSKENAELAKKFNPNGYFPLVVVLSSQQEVLGKTGYEKLPPEDYIALLNTFIK